MKIRLKDVVIGVAIFNLALLGLTLGLSKQAELQNPMKGYLVDVNGVDIHVLDSLNGHDTYSQDATYDALVLIHGASTSLLDFANNLFPTLSKQYPVVALDRPGHGYSERGTLPEIENPMTQANVIFDTLDKLNIQKPILIGHSWSGALVLSALMLDHPTITPVAGVLIAGVTHPYEREDSMPTRIALNPHYGGIFRWQYLSPIGRFAIMPTVERSFAPDTVPENYVHDAGIHLTLRPAPYLFNAIDRSNLSEYLTSQSQEYSSIDIPVLSIYATEDTVVPPADHHDKLVVDLPDTTAVEISGAGHSPHHTRTNEVIAAIKGFIQQQD